MKRKQYVKKMRNLRVQVNKAFNAHNKDVRVDICLPFPLPSGGEVSSYKQAWKVVTSVMADTPVSDKI